MYAFYFDRAQYFTGARFGGIVADMGSGLGSAAAVMANYSNVQKVYAIEYSKETVELLMPTTFEVDNAPQEKIVRSVGSFNHVELPDASLDFVVEGGAYHHSEDIHHTVAETYRLLKPGGWFVGIDRVLPNQVLESERIAGGEIAFGPRHQKRYGFEPGRTVTRADWGEHDYRACSWLHFFASAGFESHLIKFRRIDYRKEHLKALFSYLFEKRLLQRRSASDLYFTRFPRRGLIMCRKPT